jgi:hypothetical protein
MSTTTLREAKRLAKDYMTGQLRMAEKLASLTDSEMKEFNNWFRTQPLFTQLPKKMIELDNLRNKNKP